MSNIIASEHYEKNRFFREPDKRKTTSDDFHKTNEQLKAECDAIFDNKINDFFGFDGGIKELTSITLNNIQEAREEVKDNFLRTEDLKVTDDPYHAKRYEKQKHTYSKEFIEKKYAEEKERIARGESVSRSTDYVVEDKSPYAEGSPWNRTEPEPKTYGYSGSREKRVDNNRVHYGSSNRDSNSNKSTGYQTKSQGDNRKKSDSVYDHMGRIAENTQTVAMKSKPWKAYDKEEANNNAWASSRNGKRTLLGRVKRFMRKPKFRVTVKVGMLMTLQLGMAMVGKKYEFEGTGQAAMFLAMMMGVFYLTKELQNDDFDVKSFGIL